MFIVPLFLCTQSVFLYALYQCTFILKVERVGRIIEYITCKGFYINVVTGENTALLKRGGGGKTLKQNKLLLG